MIPWQQNYKRYFAKFGSIEKWNFWIIQSFFKDIELEFGMETNFEPVNSKSSINLEFDVIVTFSAFYLMKTPIDVNNETNPGFTHFLTKFSLVPVVKVSQRPLAFLHILPTYMLTRSPSRQFKSRIAEERKLLWTGQDQQCLLIKHHQSCIVFFSFLLSFKWNMLDSMLVWKF